MHDDLPSTPSRGVAHPLPVADLGHRDEHGRVVVSSAPAITAALHSRDLAVVPPSLPPGRLQALVARMARFVDGPDHQAARRVVLDALAAIDVAGLQRGALDGMRVAVARALEVAGTADVTALSRRTTTEVLARALGFCNLGRAIDALLVVARAIAPTEASEQQHPAVIDRAIEDLEAASATVDTVATANRIGLLFQAVDATTGLVTAALWPRSVIGALVPGSGADRVRAVVEDDPPVVSTRRVACRPGHVAGVPVTAGDELVLALADTAASVTTAPATRPLAFGAGHHACPGWEHAMAMAAGMVDAVAGMIADGATLQAPVREERRANLRIAESLLLTVGS